MYNDVYVQNCYDVEEIKFLIIIFIEGSSILGGPFFMDFSTDFIDLKKESYE